MTRYPPQKRPAAFTLIELLVVIAIIAILIGQLLSAVQKVREAASRAKCQNNLKQLGLALHNYHDVMGFFPTAGSADGKPLSSGPWPNSGEGTNWLVYIMPYLEQGNIYNKLTFTGDSGWTNVPGSATSSAVNNVKLSAGVVIQTYRCPSDPRTPLVGEGSNVNGGSTQVTRPSYVAIAGAVDNVDGNGLFKETRTTVNSWSPDFGRTAWGGVIVPGFSRVTIQGITDGSSNTAMVSESAARFYWKASATAVPSPAPDNEITVSANGLYRGQDGCQKDDQGNLRPMCAWSDARGQHFVTVRYRPNQKTWIRGTPNTGVFSATDGWKSEGANVPLASEHSGGVNVLAGDGSVKFLRDSVDLLMLGRYATRDDGQVVSID